MANRAVSEGITHLFATPHHLDGQYENRKIDIVENVNISNYYLKKENIPLVIYPGQELRIHREIFLSIENDEVLTLGNQDKFLLLELPSGDVPEFTLDVIYELSLRGITPIIVHPERNRRLLSDNNLLYELVQEGALTQLTAGSIIGQFGKKVQSFSEKIIEHRLSHFIASDAHNNHTRGFCLQSAYQQITERYGIQQTFYFKENAELLLNGQNITSELPLPIRKKIFGFF